MLLDQAHASGDAPYYVRNFELLLTTLRQRDADLLVLEETGFIEGFLALPVPARALLARMVMRKGAVFRAGRLGYPEIPDLPAAVSPLVALGWVDENPSLSLDEIFRLFRRDEIAGFARLGPAPAGGSKAGRLALLRARFSESLPLSAWGGSSERVFRLLVDPLCERLRGMFFGNFRQELSEFVLADLGIFRYERVVLEARSRPFSSRVQVDAFHRLQRCRERLEEGGDPGEIERDLPPPLTDCDWLEARRDRLSFRLGREWERRGEAAAALRVYDASAHPQARVRAGRLRARAAGERDGARRVGARRAVSAAIPVFELALDAAVGRGVEYRVRDVLAGSPGEGTSVHYVENALIGSLFGLLCWPAIFAPVRGAFFHAFHQGPADLTCAGFHARRRLEFEACLDELHGAGYRDTILARLADKQGILSPFVAWGLIDEALLRTALDCFPSAHLRAWFEWILRDVGTNRSGFPDLVQFWPEAGTYRLIEVKGPGDRLQENQRRCLHYCLDHGIPVSVCHVRSAAVPSELAKGRGEIGRRAAP